LALRSLAAIPARGAFGQKTTQIRWIIWVASLPRLGRWGCDLCQCLVCLHFLGGLLQDQRACPSYLYSSIAKDFRLGLILAQAIFCLSKEMNGIHFLAKLGLSGLAEQFVPYLLPPLG